MLAMVVDTGSPPHMRGKDDLLRRPEASGGITPAHAGKSDLKEAQKHMRKDHPRTCGEKRDFILEEQCGWGSPPHMRGKGAAIDLSTAANRITPAHAGKRNVKTIHRPSRLDHPRTCGEKPTLYAHRCRLWGSPPHMRGKEKAYVGPINGLRITPAHAGKSIECNRFATVRQDHPRTCGEKCFPTS